jgi:Tol biopolymer transport system component
MCASVTARRVAGVILLAAAPFLGGVACHRQATAPLRVGLIVGYPAGLVEVRLDGTRADVIVASGSGAAVPRSPALSPDGRSLVYVEAGSPAGDAGADLWVAGRDGSGRRLVVKHLLTNHSLRSPRWEDNRHVLVVLDVPATCQGCNPLTTTAQDLERVDVATGAMRVVQRNVVEFDLAPGGARVAFPDAGHEDAEGLRTANLDGSSISEIVPLSQRFAQVGSPRYSPDGTRIAFAAAEPRALVAGTSFISRQGFGPARSPQSDGLPTNVWIVDATGAHLHVLAGLHENALSLAWDPSGETLYAVGAAGLYRIDVKSGDVARIGPGATGATIEYASLPS